MKSVFILALAVFSPQECFGAGEDNYNLSRTIKPAPIERFFVYESAIIPWLEREFAARAVLKEGSFIKRRLKKCDLMRFEVIEGQDRYNVHIEYHVSIKDISGVELSGIKGQEIVFWVKNNRVRDFFPFHEYWINRTVSQEGGFY